MSARVPAAVGVGLAVADYGETLTAMYASTFACIGSALAICIADSMLAARRRPAILPG